MPSFLDVAKADKGDNNDDDDDEENEGNLEVCFDLIFCSTKSSLSSSLDDSESNDYKVSRQQHIQLLRICMSHESRILCYENLLDFERNDNDEGNDDDKEFGCICFKNGCRRY